MIVYYTITSSDEYISLQPFYISTLISVELIKINKNNYLINNLKKNPTKRYGILKIKSYL